MNNVNTTFKNRLAIYILSVTNRHYFSINVMYPKLGCAIFNLFTKHFFWNNDSPKPPNYFKKLAQINSYPLNKSRETISKITKARGRPQFEIHIYIYRSNVGDATLQKVCEAKEPLERQDVCPVSSRTMANRWDSGTGDVIPFPI